MFTYEFSWFLLYISSQIYRYTIHNTWILQVRRTTSHFTASKKFNPPKSPFFSAKTSGSPRYHSSCPPHQHHGPRTHHNVWKVPSRSPGSPSWVFAHHGLTVSHEWVGWLGFYPADFAHNLHVLLFFKEKHVGQWDRDNSYTLVFDTIESDLVPIFVVHIVSL